MTGSEDDPLFLALRPLRADYLADPPGKVAELWRVLARVQNGERAAVRELRTLLHHLAGSGGAYGLPSVTESARKAEQVIDRCEPPGDRPSPADLAELRMHLTGVADAFDQARSTE